MCDRAAKPLESLGGWESPELKILISATSSDPRAGDIEYRLTNVRRVEPPPDLFVVPPDYVIDYSGSALDPLLTLIPAIGSKAEGSKKLR